MPYELFRLRFHGAAGPETLDHLVLAAVALRLALHATDTAAQKPATAATRWGNASAIARMAKAVAAVV